MRHTDPRHTEGFPPDPDQPPSGGQLPRAQQGETERIERVRALVLEHGWNATCYQLINPGIEHWFDPRGDAVVGYVRRHRVHVAAGAPVCAPERLAEVVAAFESAARALGDTVCYFGAEQRLEELTHDDRGHSRVLLGAQPVWDPAHWSAIIARRASLRAQLNRGRNKGVTIVEWPTSRARGNEELRAVLIDWLQGRGLPPLHFLVEPETLARLIDRRVFVASVDGATAGFAVASPVPRRNGWLIEQIVRSTGAPNGMTELLVDAIMRAVAADGAHFVTLGLSPLSRQVDDPTPTPLWLRGLLTWTREHGRRFYNFEGLDRFKAKFDPERWDPVYAISNEPRITVRTMYAIATAFSGGSPVALILRGIARKYGL
jgi:phosphatidylglycerol lysyltransferase